MKFVVTVTLQIQAGLVIDADTRKQAEALAIEQLEKNLQESPALFTTVEATADAVPEHLSQV